MTPPTGSALLAADLVLGGRALKSRAYFGPHPTNLNRRNEFRPAYAAYLAARAAGGVALLVSEAASVSPDDWPYEYAPLLPEAAGSLAAVARAVHKEGSLLLAGLNHAGGQGSSAYSQQALSAPSPFAETTANELSSQLDEEQIEAIVAAFATAARTALSAGCDGVEVNAGQYSLIRQFLSPLTNQRQDRWGEDRTLFAARVLHGVREQAREGIVGLRLCVDELAPWAGILPAQAASIFAKLEGYVDYLVLERGSIYTQHATIPDFHDGAAFLDQAVEEFRGTHATVVPLAVLDGRVGLREAEEQLARGTVQLAELTRPLIADPQALTGLAGMASARPCAACNQGCQVRDPRNPVVSCAFNPDAGHESEAAGRITRAVRSTGAAKPPWLVAGAGIAGMEAALEASRLGMSVRLCDASDQPGGELRLLAEKGLNPNLAGMFDYYLRALAAAKVEISTSCHLDPAEALAHAQDGGPVVAATGATYSPRPWNLGRLTGTGPQGAPVVTTMREALMSPPAAGVKVALFDPTGGVWAMTVMDALLASGTAFTLITPDRLAGSQLAPTGDLVPAAQRLARAGVRVLADSQVAGLVPGGVRIQERFGAGSQIVEADVLLDCSLPAAPGGWPEHELLRLAGDALAPRGWQAAILDARKAVSELAAEVAGGRL